MLIYFRISFDCATTPSNSMPMLYLVHEITTLQYKPEVFNLTMISKLFEKYKKKRFVKAQPQKNIYLYPFFTFHNLNFNCKQIIFQLGVSFSFNIYGILSLIGQRELERSFSLVKNGVVFFEEKKRCRSKCLVKHSIYNI